MLEQEFGPDGFPSNLNHFVILNSRFSAILKIEWTSFSKYNIATDDPAFGQGLNEITFGCWFLIKLSIIAMIYEA